MANDPDALISLDAVTKVFVTDEVETHALAGIHLHIKKGEYLSIAGRRAAASPLCWRSWDCSIRPATGRTF